MLSAHSINSRPNRWWPSSTRFWKPGIFQSKQWNYPDTADAWQWNRAPWCWGLQPFACGHCRRMYSWVYNRRPCNVWPTLIKRSIGLPGHKQADPPTNEILHCGYPVKPGWWGRWGDNFAIWKANCLSFQTLLLVPWVPPTMIGYCRWAVLYAIKLIGRLW